MPAPAAPRYALAVLTLIYVLHFIDRQILVVLVEPIKQEFRASDSQMGLLTGLAFALLYAVLGIPIARFADRRSRRNIVAVCCAWWSAFTIVCGQSGSYVALLLARMGVAAGAAGGTAPMLAMVADLFAPARRPLAMSVFGLGPHLGVIVALTAGGWIAQHHGWRTAFVWMGVPGILMALVLLLTVREPVRGAADGLTNLPATDEALSRRDSTTATALRILAKRPLGLLLLAVGTAGFVGHGFGAWNVSYLVRTHGLPLQQAGAIAGLAGGTGAIVGMLFAGWLCKRLTSRDAAWQLRVPAIGLLLSLPIGVIYCSVPANIAHPAAWLASLSAAFGFFAPWWTAQTFTAVANLVAPGERALATSLMILSFTIFGGGFGPLFTGALSDALAAHAGADGLRQALAVTVAASAIPAMLYLTAAPSYRRVVA
jgi:MFS family permease